MDTDEMPRIAIPVLQGSHHVDMISARYRPNLWWVCHRLNLNKAKGEPATPSHVAPKDLMY